MRDINLNIEMTSPSPSRWKTPVVEGSVEQKKGFTPLSPF